MLMHPDVMLTLAHDRHRELVAEAERERLLAGARRGRRTRRDEVRGRPAARPAAGTVSPCEPSVAVPAR
jgi:hypothetical protein